MRKNSKVIIAVMLAFIVFLSSCKQTSTPSGTAETSTPSDTAGTSTPSDIEETSSDDSTDTVQAYDGTENQEDSIIPATREYFENVDKNYGLDDIFEEIGPTFHTEGSGIIYWVWDLTDGTEAYVCFSARDGKISRIHIVTPGQPDELLYWRHSNS